MSTPPTPLTRKSLIGMSTEELKKIVHDPQRLAEVNSILSEEIPEEKEQVQETQVPEDAAVADEAAKAAKEEEDRLAEVAKEEATRLALAEEESYKAAGVSVTKDGNGNITKLVMNYQARDDAGNPIGRPTYLEAKTWLELITKQRSAHENAVRFAERIKKQNITKKKDAPPSVEVLSEDQLLKLQEDLKSEDRDKASKAAEEVRKNDERKRILEAEAAIENARQAKESYEFLAAHVNDFNRCEANIKLLRDYIADNNLEWTKGNLDAALIATESQQAPFELKDQKEPVVPPAPANPAPAAPAVSTPPPVDPAPPAQQVTQNNPALPAARPGVNGGLVPGQQSAPRPTGQPKGLTKADIKAMSREEYKRRLKDPKFVSEVNALLARR